MSQDKTKESKTRGSKRGGQRGGQRGTGNKKKKN